MSNKNFKEKIAEIDKNYNDSKYSEASEESLSLNDINPNLDQSKLNNPFNVATFNLKKSIPNYLSVDQPGHKVNDISLSYNSKNITML
ncbi:hypothetical protein N9C35_03460 [Flavobacteriaceae bacterium]|nr:hypothetical protein [Flavobacteriaceae bacterium]